MHLSIFGGRDELARTVPVDGDSTIVAFGGATINLSRLNMPESLHLSGLAMFGGIKYIVPRGTDVVFRGFSLFGGQSFKPQRDQASGAYRSVIYLNAVAVFGTIEVIEAAE